jgi:Na+/H+ antiporter NhaC
VIPVVTVVLTVLIGLVYTGQKALAAGEPTTLRAIFGNADPFVTLLWGSLLGCVVAMVLAVTQRILTLREAVAAWVAGLRAMMLAVVILVLAWSLGEITNSLSTASYLAGIISDRLPLALLPVTVFIVAALISFATGTSWGTMAILIPLVIPLAVALGAGLEGGPAATAFFGGIASVLAGSIFGDHCSPISDTTVLSSTASGCDHVDHVQTQLPYALMVAVAAMLLGSLPTAAGLSPWVSILLGCAVIWVAVRVLGKRSDGTVAN